MLLDVNVFVYLYIYLRYIFNNIGYLYVYLRENIFSIGVWLREFFVNCMDNVR